MLDGPLALPVARVIPDVDPRQGAFAFRVKIPAERRGKLTAGAFLLAEVQLPAAGGEVVVPLRAIAEGDGGPWVFVAENGKARRLKIEIGERLTESVIVRAGVTAGQKVLVGPVGALRDGAELPAELRTR
jgi:membrane fusion protein, multidrug efflux system